MFLSGLKLRQDVVVELSLDYHYHANSYYQTLFFRWYYVVIIKFDSPIFFPIVFYHHCPPIPRSVISSIEIVARDR